MRVGYDISQSKKRLLIIPRYDISTKLVPINYIFYRLYIKYEEPENCMFQP
jgi:hypothetical protein